MKTPDRGLPGEEVRRQIRAHFHLSFPRGHHHHHHNHHHDCRRGDSHKLRRGRRPQQERAPAAHGTRQPSPSGANQGLIEAIRKFCDANLGGKRGKTNCRLANATKIKEKKRKAWMLPSCTVQHTIQHTISDPLTSSHVDFLDNGMSDSESTERGVYGKGLDEVEPKPPFPMYVPA